MSSINDFLNGQVLVYPDELEMPFFWKTKKITNKETVFDQKFTPTKKLDVPQNYTAFEKYIHLSTNDYAVAFQNLTGDLILVIPMPRAKKDFSNLKRFMDTASLLQQREFWKTVGRMSSHLLKYHSKIQLEAHGLSVPYLHIRISVS